jgi:hypothetical protein
MKEETVENVNITKYAYTSIIVDIKCCALPWPVPLGANEIILHTFASESISS